LRSCSDVSGQHSRAVAFEQQAAVALHQTGAQARRCSVCVFDCTTPKIIKTRTSKRRRSNARLMSIAPVKEPTAFFDTVADGRLYLGKTADPGSRASACGDL